MISYTRANQQCPFCFLHIWINNCFEIFWAILQIQINKKFSFLKRNKMIFDCLQEDSFRQGFDRISSAPRLSFSNEDVFNVRNHHLSQLSHSSPGIYKKETFQHQVIYNSTSSMPKSILLKPKETGNHSPKW